MDYKEYIVRVYNGRTEWRNKERQLHREDGPAVEFANGEKFWYINGKQFAEQEFNNRKKEFSMDEIAKALGVPVGELRIKKD